MTGAHYNIQISEDKSSAQASVKNGDKTTDAMACITLLKGSLSKIEVDEERLKFLSSVLENTTRQVGLGESILLSRAMYDELVKEKQDAKDNPVSDATVG